MGFLERSVYTLVLMLLNLSKKIIYATVLESKDFQIDTKTETQQEKCILRTAELEIIMATENRNN